MSSPQYDDRQLTTHDEKRKKLDFSEMRLELPATNISDSPYRCYRANLDWTPIIEGWLDLLTEVAAWYEADDESYEGIRQIQYFLRGVDCMDCSELQNCIDTSPTFQSMKTFIYNNTTHIDYENETINNYFQAGEMDEYIGGDTPDPIPPDTCNKDAVWAAVASLVNYINDLNLDMLQNLAQATNLTAQAERLISAIPGVGILPADEIIGYVDVISNNLYSEYLATVTVQLLQEVMCDLFCIALDNDPCGLTFGDLIDYYAGKTPAAQGRAVDTFLDLVGFAVTGTFQGDDYYYYLCYLQLFTTWLGEEFFGHTGVKNYSIAAAAGFNSPDADWELYCETCPQPGFELYFDFEAGTQVPPVQAIVGKYQGGNYWRADQTANNLMVWLRLFMYAETVWEQIEVDYYRLTGSGAPGSEHMSDGFPVTALTYGVDHQTDIYDGSRTGQLEFKMRATSNRLSYPGADVRVYNVYLRGTGLVHPDFAAYMISGELGT